MSPELAHRHQIASLLFTSLIRSSEKCKTLARSIIPSVVASHDPSAVPVTPAQLFSPMDHPPSSATAPQGPPRSAQAPPVTVDDDEDPPQALLSTVSECLAMALRSRSISRERGDPDLREWDRVLVGYLILLSAWVWDSPIAVKDLLEEGGVMTVVSWRSTYSRYLNTRTQTG